jgi:hypothetical protein
MDSSAFFHQLYCLLSASKSVSTTTIIIRDDNARSHFNPLAQAPHRQQHRRHSNMRNRQHERRPRTPLCRWKSVAATREDDAFCISSPPKLPERRISGACKPSRLPIRMRSFDVRRDDCSSLQDTLVRLASLRSAVETTF